MNSMEESKTKTFYTKIQRFCGVEPEELWKRSKSQITELLLKVQHSKEHKEKSSERSRNY